MWIKPVLFLLILFNFIGVQADLTAQTDKNCSPGEECEKKAACPYVQEKYQELQSLNRRNEKRRAIVQELKAAICNKKEKTFCCPKTDWSAGVVLNENGRQVVTNIGEKAFNSYFARCPVVRYSRNGAVYAVYMRTSPIPPSFNAFTLFTDTWASDHNQINVDFKLYNSLEDAKGDEGAWAFCNYDDPDVGFPRDCGKTGPVGGKWFYMPGGRFDQRVEIGTGSGFLIFTGSMCPAPLISVSCPIGWTALETGCYRFVEAPTFNQAITRCNEKGGYTAEIKSQNEQDAFSNFMKDSGFSRRAVFLGASLVGNKWIWFHSKQEMTFSAWIPGQPSGGGETCVAAWGIDDTSLWNDIRCDSDHNGNGHLALCQHSHISGLFSDPVDACLQHLNNEIITGITLEECKEKCSSATSFICHSLDYERSVSRCFLSEDSKKTQPSAYKEPCYDGTDSTYLEQIFTE